MDTPLIDETDVGRFPEPEAPCAFCGKPVKPGAIGTYTEQAGWAKVRAEGGTNALKLRRSLNRVAHGHCVEFAVLGGEQESLFT